MDEDTLNSSDAYYFEGDYTNYGNASYYPIDDGALVCSQQGARDFSRVFVPVAYSLICVFGLLGNTLVVITFACYKKAKSMTDVYLLHMALADVLFVLTLPFWAVDHAAGTWVFSNALCKVLKGTYAVNFHCGMLLLTCVSLDRYVAIVQATRSFRLRSRTLAHSKAVCLAVWLLAVIISSSAFTFSQKYELQGRQVCEPRYQTVLEPVRWKLLVLGLELLFGFFVPLACMGFCYLFIVKTLVQAQNSKRHRAIRVILAVVLVFLACQIPHNAVQLVTAANLGRTGRSCERERLLGYVKNVTEVLAFLHCCLNPVLYAFIGHKFRSYFLKIMKDFWCLGRKRPVPGSSSSRAYSETGPARLASETVDNDNVSSFTM